MDDIRDCIVVGGGAAGLSAALVLGRARRSTLVIDAGAPSNAPAHGIGGLLGNDGRPPADFYAAGRRELAAYPSVALRAGEVVAGARAGDRITLTLSDGDRVTARRVVLATGMDYVPPTLPGVAERWGRTVFHCPFCHGWEVRDRPLAVLDRGASGVHRALLLRMWSDDVTLLADGPAGLDDGEAASLRAAGVPVDERPVAGLEGPGATLTSVRMADGTARPCGGLLVPVTLRQRSPLAAQLGAVAAAPGFVATDAVAVDAMARTTAPGVFAAGDLTTQMPSVASAVAAGSLAAAMVVQAIVAEGLPATTAPAEGGP
ncbi:NAD(P)/FAD-dependent oxidoreductase [Miltoncostaea oceani]|uniref:NAD(P)/FAD-dependent oxidoreductase n=1 Tax=Miltoncostaea oceani TaxID=2843216 RepID=UPI001C3D4002|nr:NAD(P)/FAD-dependent oxidoreductase [Miltoncostaea oceani]